MVKVALLVAVLVGAQGTNVYRDDQLRLAFDYPKTWVAGKKVRDASVLKIPIEGSTDSAKLEIMRAPYHLEPENWQTIQREANKNLKREVVRQWQDEILGVPMLLTLIHYTDSSVPTSTLTGLLYTRTPTKLLFRLTGPEADFDKVLFDFQNAIQTLRTIGDQPLAPEDPTKPPVKPTEPTTTKVDLRPPKKVTFVDKPKKKEAVQGPVTVDVMVATRALQVRLPQDWTAEKKDDDTLVLRHPKLSEPVQLQVLSLIETDPPKFLLFKKSNESLNGFQKVSRRLDVEDRTSRGGMLENVVWRLGDSATGSLFTMDAAISNDTHVASLSYKGSKDADRRILEEMLDILSVAPAP